MSVRTQGRVDVEPPRVADSLRECMAASPRAWQAIAEMDVVDDVEDEVVTIFSSGSPSSLASSRNIFLQFVRAAVVIRQCRLLLIYLMSSLTFVCTYKLAF
jgi:hypothetical protein